MWLAMHSHNHHLSVPGDNAGHPFVANDPHEEDPENLHAGGSLRLKSSLQQ